MLVESWTLNAFFYLSLATMALPFVEWARQSLTKKTDIMTSPLGKHWLVLNS